MTIDELKNKIGAMKALPECYKAEGLTTIGRATMQARDRVIDTVLGVIEVNRDALIAGMQQYPRAILKELCPDESYKIHSLHTLAAKHIEAAMQKPLREIISKAWYERSVDASLGDVLKLIDGEPNIIDGTLT